MITLIITIYTDLYQCIKCIGQFLNADVNTDTENMLMKLGDRDPILVKRGKAWPFLGIDDEYWYAVDTNNQGVRIIKGHYTEYIVDHLIPKEM